MYFKVKLKYSYVVKIIRIIPYYVFLQKNVIFSVLTVSIMKIINFFLNLLFTVY